MTLCIISKTFVTISVIEECSFPDIDNPTFTKTASFDDICNLYAEESKRPLTLAHKLTKKSLTPKNIDKTSVKLSNAIFHETTLHALQYLSTIEKN